MKAFVDFLKKGEFRLPVCMSCHEKVWPPSSYCPSCLSKTKLKKIKLTGTLLEFTSSYLKDNGTFGIIDVGGIRMVGSINSRFPVNIGMKMKMSKCGVLPDGRVFYNFKPAK